MEQTFYQQVGALIKQERLRHKYSMIELGVLVGVARQTIWNWEHGQNGVTLHHLCHVAQVLGVSVCDLLPKYDKNVVYRPVTTIDGRVWKFVDGTPILIESLD